MSFGHTYNNEDHPGKSFVWEKYVYYRRLNTDYYDESTNQFLRQIYGEANKQLTDVVGASIEDQAADTANFFFHLRDKEMAKELDAIESITGIIPPRATLDYDRVNDWYIGQKLIELVNKAMMLEDVFQRHLDLIINGTDSKTFKKQSITYMASYISTQWNKVYAQKTIDELKEVYNPDVSMSENLLPILRRNVEQMVQSAAVEAVNARTDDKSRIAYDNGNKVFFKKTGYQQLLETLNNILNTSTNEFIASLIKTYKLDDLAENLTEEILQSQNIEKTINSTKLDYNSYDIHQRGALAVEAFSKFLFDITNRYMSGLNSFATGSLGLKADAIFTSRIDPARIEQILMSDETLRPNDNSKRVQNVAEIQRLNHHLRKVRRGFIVYSNAKNYILGEKFGGFKAGEPIKLQTFWNMMTTVRMKAGDLLYAAMQLPKGAIGDDQEEAISLLYARTIATALFDDVKVVADNKSEPNSIHLLYLNGIYFPISFYYHLLGKAFSDFSRDRVKGLVEVEFHNAGSILWETKEEQSAWENAHPGQSAWGLQARTTLDTMTISYYFLAEFQNIMRDLNFKL